MEKPPYGPDLYIGEVDMVDAVEHYQCMRHSLYALQVALARTCRGFNAFSIGWTAVYLLKEVVSNMPVEVIEEWARLDRMSIAEIRREQPGG